MFETAKAELSWSWEPGASFGLPCGCRVTSMTERERIFSSPISFSIITVARSNPGAGTPCASPMWLAGDPKLTDWELGQKQSTQDSNQHFDVVSLTHRALSSQNFCNIENYVWKKKKSLWEKNKEKYKGMKIKSCFLTNRWENILINALCTEQLVKLLLVMPTFPIRAWGPNASCSISDPTAR